MPESNCPPVSPCRQARQSPAHITRLTPERAERSRPEKMLPYSVSSAPCQEAILGEATFGIVEHDALEDFVGRIWIIGAASKVSQRALQNLRRFCCHRVMPRAN